MKLTRKHIKRLPKKTILQKSASQIKEILWQNRKIQESKSEQFSSQEIAKARRELSSLSTSDKEFIDKHPRSIIPTVLSRINRIINVDIAKEQRQILGRWFLYMFTIIFISFIVAISVEVYYTIKNNIPHKRYPPLLQAGLNYASAPEQLKAILPRDHNLKTSIWHSYSVKMLNYRYVSKHLTVSTIRYVFAIVTSNKKVSTVAQQLKICRSTITIAGNSKKNKISTVDQTKLFWSFWIFEKSQINCFLPLSYTPGVGLSAFTTLNTLTYSYLDLDLNSFPNNKFPDTADGMEAAIKTDYQQKFFATALEGKVQNKRFNLQLAKRNVLISSKSEQRITANYELDLNLQLVNARNPHSSIRGSHDFNQQKYRGNGSLETEIDCPFKDYTSKNSLENVGEFSLEEHARVDGLPINLDNTQWLDSTNFSFKNPKDHNKVLYKWTSKYG